MSGPCRRPAVAGDGKRTPRASTGARGASGWHGKRRRHERRRHRRRHFTARSYPRQRPAVRACKLPSWQPALKHLSCLSVKRSKPGLHANVPSAHAAPSVQRPPSAGHSHGSWHAWPAVSFHLACARTRRARPLSHVPSGMRRSFGRNRANCMLLNHPTACLASGRKQTPHTSTRPEAGAPDVRWAHKHNGPRSARPRAGRPGPPPCKAGTTDRAQAQRQGPSPRAAGRRRRGTCVHSSATHSDAEPRRRILGSSHVKATHSEVCSQVPPLLQWHSCQQVPCCAGLAHGTGGAVSRLPRRAAQGPASLASTRHRAHYRTYSAVANLRWTMFC